MYYTARQLYWMNSVYRPLQDQVVDQTIVTRTLCKLQPIPHTQQQYLAALHQKTLNEDPVQDRRPYYQNPILHRLSTDQQNNDKCRQCNDELSWGTGKVLCRFCGYWVCSGCIAKERLDPQDDNIRAKICQLCEDQYLRTTISHEFYNKENILLAAFSRLVDEQFQLEKLNREEIKRISDNDKKNVTKKAMCKILAINNQKIENDALKDQLESLKTKLDKAEKIYKQLALKCQSKKKTLMDSKASFTSEISRANLVVDEEENLEPPTALASTNKASMAMTSSPRSSLVGSILDEYEKTKEKRPRQEQEDNNSHKGCRCILF